MTKRVKKTRKKTTAQTTAVVAIERIPQEHGGALNAGGTIGNVGGIGVVPSAVRQLCLGSFHARVPILERIADGDTVVKMRTPDGVETETTISAPTKERIRAIEILGKYAGLEKITVEQEKPAQGEATGEAVMTRVLGMIGRALLAAPAAQRLAVISELERGDLAP